MRKYFFDIHEAAVGVSKCSQATPQSDQNQIKLIEKITHQHHEHEL